MIERGQRHDASSYERAQSGAAELRRELDGVLSRYDAVLAPAATGAAPLGLASTGSPIFCTLWTLAGVPAVTLPLLHDADGMPMGVQLVAAKGRDGHLLRVAKTLEARA
jgi:Asp-tRNA(Asn)/Glu-tRNA(Gln) amidotransferase A subunit family amidase